MLEMQTVLVSSFGRLRIRARSGLSATREKAVPSMRISVLHVA